MLQAVFHPRINYPVTETPAQPSRVKGVTDVGIPVMRTDTVPEVPPALTEDEQKTERAALLPPVEAETPRPQLKTGEIPAMVLDENEDTPLAEVPPLPRTGEHKKVGDNGRRAGDVSEKRTEVRDNE